MREQLRYTQSKHFWHFSHLRAQCAHGPGVQLAEDVAEYDRVDLRARADAQRGIEACSFASASAHGRARGTSTPLQYWHFPLPWATGQAAPDTPARCRYPATPASALPAHRGTHAAGESRTPVAASAPPRAVGKRLRLRQIPYRGVAGDTSCNRPTSAHRAEDLAPNYSARASACGRPRYWPRQPPRWSAHRRGLMPPLLRPAPGLPPAMGNPIAAADTWSSSRLLE
ncbi:hypothetical protein C8F04DRAFT_1396744 [Mycena alexandri]|uniref:Uncharacterized protein n=1 Tax=Mycena alexandri TaxID=1745969 RepID=A0AAD6SV41_9AGAR|nr:hypothetical protein C8F04DRAFT_1396744 [Mycena alexandri]